MKINKQVLISFISLLMINTSSVDAFDVVVTLNNVTKTFVFSNSETALATDQTQFRNDFLNPDTGKLPNTSVGQITQFGFDGVPLTLVKISSDTVIMTPVPGVTADFISFNGTQSSINQQIESLLTTGAVSSTAVVGLSEEVKKELEVIIEEQIPKSNQTLKNNLTTAVVAVDVNNVTKETVKEISQQIIEKLAIAANSPIRDDAILAKFNPTASIAGNPASLMGTMVDQIFTQNGLEGRYTKNRNSAAASSDKYRGFSFGGGLQYGYYNLAGSEVHTLTTPLSLGVRFNPKHQLIFSLPLTYIDTEGNSSYQVGVGLAYKYNIMENWALIPAINYGYRGTPKSRDGLARTEGQILAGTLTNKYIYNFDDKDRESFKLGMTNMIGYFQTLNMETTIGNTSYQTSGKVANTVLKNSFSLSKRIGVFDVSAFITDTEYFGSELYFEQYNEAGIAIRTDRAGKYFDSLSLSANYVFSLVDNDELEGFRFNFNYIF